MKLLLDTHAWLWALLDEKKLGSKARRLLEAPSNELWLSPISIWEVALLAENKRIHIPTSIEKWVDESFQKLPVTEAPVTRSVAIASRSIRVSHEDPADRFIAATANVFDLTLVTADERLLAGRGYKTLAAR